MQKQNLNHELDLESASFVTFLEGVSLTPAATTKDQLLYQCGISAAQAEYRQAQTRSRWLTTGLVCVAMMCGIWTGRQSNSTNPTLLTEQPNTSTPAKTSISLPNEPASPRPTDVLLASMSMEQMEIVLANEKTVSLGVPTQESSTSLKTWSAGMSARELESMLPL